MLREAGKQTDLQIEIQTNRLIRKDKDKGRRARRGRGGEVGGGGGDGISRQA